jgi:hypothetical protein
MGINYLLRNIKLTILAFLTFYLKLINFLVL